MEVNANQQNDQKTKSITIWFSIAAGLVILFWLTNWFLVGKYLDYAEGGQFGDRFGATTSLFGGLTIIGLLYTIYLQREDLKIAREANRLSIEELKTTNSRFEEQNTVLELQRFETTFFNLLEKLGNIDETSITSTSDRIRLGLVNYGTLHDARDCYQYSEVGNWSIEEYVELHFKTYFKILESIAQRISLDIAQTNHRVKYYQIVECLIDKRIRLIFQYHLHLRTEGVPNNYPDFSRFLFADLRPYDPSHVVYLSKSG